MRAVYLHNKQLHLRTDYPAPKPRPGEALIRLALAGICSTDLELVKGYYPFTGVLGHEFVGVVEACDDVAWIGRRVVGTINISPACGGACGLRCPEHCPHRTVLGIKDHDGAFADYLTLPTANLLPVPSSLTDAQAVFTEPLAAAVRITEQVRVAGRRAAVIGPGRLGLLAAQVLRHAGADVTVIGRSEASLQLPRDLQFPVAYHDTPTLTDLDLVVEATGSPAGFELAVAITRPNGVLVLKSTYAAAPDLKLGSLPSVLAAVVVNELTVIGSRCGPFDKALALLAQHTVLVEPLIERTYPLDEALAAFAHAARPGVRKVLLQP